MKKIVKILLYFILFILLVLIVAPILFKGKIIEIANEQANKTLNAKVAINDVSMSFFRKFPNLSVGLDEIEVIGEDVFEGDTLLYLQRFELVVNPWAMIGDQSIDIQKILIHKLIMNAIVLEDGTANWDIVPEGEEKDEEESDTAGGEFDLSLALKLFSIQNANISYSDKGSNLFASLKNFNIDITGNMTKDFSTIIVNSNCDAINFGMGPVNYLTNTLFGMYIDIDANLKENIYILQENNISFNELTLKWDGSVEMPDSTEIKVDLKYATSNTSFKSLLSLVPAVYTSDFEGLQTNGNLLLEGTIKGSVIDDFIPDVDGKLVVSNASIQYPNLPKSINNINVDIAYHVDGKQMDNTEVDIQKFHLDLGENPVDLAMQLRTPISDPFINGNININADLNTFSDVLPLTNTTISGKVNTYIDLMGNLSLIENEQYEEFKADGQIKLDNIVYSSADLPFDTKINNAFIEFSPQYLDISSLNVNLGNSDIRLNGKVSNFLPFVFKDETIKGNMQLSSNTFDLDQIMDMGSPDTSETADTSASEPMEVIEIPKNIDFVFNSNIGHVKYEKMDIDNLEGDIIVRDGVVKLDKLSLDALGGNLLVTGEYNTLDIDNPLVDFKVQANSINIPKTVTTFTVAEKIAPVVKRANGNISMGLEFTSFLKSDMKPVLKSIVGGGNLSSNKIGVKEAPVMNALSSELKTDKFKELVLDNIELMFEIASGKLMVEPFELNIGNSNMLIAGNQSFDNSLDYDINLSIPSEVLGKQSWANSLQSTASSKGLSFSGNDMLNIAAKVTGEMKEPKVSLNWKKSLASGKEQIKQELKQNVQATIDDSKEQAKAKAKAEADKIIKTAEAQAAEVKKQAKAAADVVRKEANATADKTVKQAKNPIAKVAAEKVADKIRNEGEAKAQRIEKEANTRADKIINDAKKKADNLLK